MILLTVNELRKYYGPEPVLDGVTFDIRPGERIGLVGPNGTGKSTLLKIIAGLEDASGGSLALHSSAKLGYLEQQPEFPAGKTLREIAREALAELLELAAQAESVAHDLAAAKNEAQRTRRGAQFDRLHHELHRRDAYQLDHRLDRVLTGLGFEPDQYDQPVQTLSGGQQNRLLLARLLLQQPDLMLLDEPSNHLDIEATEWLESFLASSQQAILLVSHDRYFLDKVTTRTLELFHGTVESYPGNFSAYWRQKAERVEVQRRTWDRQQEEIAKLKDFIRRNSYGQKSAQAEDRRKKLDRIVPVPPPREIALPPMGFPAASRTGDIVLRVEHLAKGFDFPLFTDLSFDILRGERWGILGPNGSGKTTLLRCLMGIHKPDAGNVIHGAGVAPGYFDQLLSFDNPQALVVDAVRPSHKEFIEQQRRDLLARFGITGDMVFQPVASLSGGERNRVALARLAASDANFLLLDEPTNHLDLWARDALERALKKFEGTLLFVSHDRYFLNQVADHLLVVEPGRFRVIEGGYDTYLNLTRGGSQASATGGAGDTRPAAAAPPKPEPAKAPPRNSAEPKRKRKFPYRKVEDLEAEIAAAEGRIDQLHQLLASPEILRDGGAVKRTRTELETLEERLAGLMEHWEEASELN